MDKNFELKSLLGYALAGVVALILAAMLGPIIKLLGVGLLMGLVLTVAYRVRYYVEKHIILPVQRRVEKAHAKRVEREPEVVDNRNADDKQGHTACM